MHGLLLLILAGVLSAAPEAATHPFSVHDMLAMQRIAEPEVSPDGSIVVFTLRTTDLDADRGTTDLWMVQTGDGTTGQLTRHAAHNWNPRFSPEGRMVYFLSTRSGTSQVWRIDVDGTEARQVTDLPLDVSNLILSPDGRRMAFTLDVFPDAKSLAETRLRLDERAERKASGQIFDQLFVRHWDTWADGRRSHLFVMPTTGQGEPVDVMRGMDADTPSKPFGGSEEFCFTPDGQQVVFSAKVVAGSEEAWSTDFDLYLAPVDGSTPPTCLTEKNAAWDTCPTFSPDGKTMAYLAMARPGYESDRFRIVLRAWPDGEDRVLTEEWDRSPSSLCWAGDGKSLLATAPNVGQTSLFRIDAATGAARLIVRSGTVRSPRVANGRIVYSLDNLRSPAELYINQPDGADPKPLTRINAERVAAARMGDFEQFTFRGHNDETVHAYVGRPVDFDPTKRYPVAFLIHGGPQGSFGNTFHYRWNPQAYAGAGYAVVMIDFHGSTGYGQAFCDSIRGDWGGKPLEDLQKGLAAALNRYRWMDGNRVGALGASFGGYMVNWIAGNWPERFRCLVNHDGNLDERAAYYGTEELWFPEWDHEGTPWDNAESYERHNPVNFVDRWKTPMLVIHGANDYRIPDTQGLATFNVLQRRGIPSRLLYFPDENHWVLKPANSILWHDTVIGWLDQWLKPEAE